MDRNENDAYYNPRGKVFETNPIAIALAVMASALIGWAVSSLAAYSHTELLSGFSTAIVCAIILTVRCSIVSSRLGTMIKADCWLFLVLSLAASVVLALWCPMPKYFIIIDGLLMIVFLSSVYKLSKTNV